VHESPVLHTDPVQQGCPEAPHIVGAVSHRVVALHWSPASQSLPPQHASPRWPHEGMRQRPELHRSEPVHTSPAQQIWFSIPHGGRWQRPLVQRKSGSQLSPRQHAAPSRPHATHIPLWQMPPGSHTSPQHVLPTTPQRPVSSGGGESTVTGASFAGAEVSSGGGAPSITGVFVSAGTSLSTGTLASMSKGASREASFAPSGEPVSTLPTMTPPSSKGVSRTPRAQPARIVSKSAKRRRMAGDWTIIHVGLSTG
jgi:hypothetical protein